MDIDISTRWYISLVGGDQVLVTFSMLEVDIVTQTNKHFFHNRYIVINGCLLVSGKEFHKLKHGSIIIGC